MCPDISLELAVAMGRDITTPNPATTQVGVEVRKVAQLHVLEESSKLLFTGARP